MSEPQHIGDLIFLFSSFTHIDTWTVEPSSLVRIPFTKGSSQQPQLAFTDIPQEAQV